METKASFIYQGNGRCLVAPKVGSAHVIMDAPAHCGGSGENWTPGDWLGYAFAGCVVISMDGAAKKAGFNIAGATAEVSVQMGGTPPKVVSLKAILKMPKRFSNDEVNTLKEGAKMCPIHNSMCSETRVQVEIVNG